ncbi:WD40 repeat domain-containing protein [Pannus brasiliensis CCIBt3594]|uniref:WD40 repeat domain-containing protein n=1 Tax=Pannus brasiliensis CCIBt3594 TaxID=1427578 RepID=A0AAW9QYG7_9CHRO
MEWQLALQLLQGLPTLLEILTTLQKWSIDEPKSSPRISPSVDKKQADHQDNYRSLQQQKILEQWPLGLVPSQFAGEKIYGIPALQVLLAPLYREGTDPALEENFSPLETRLSRDLGDFLSQHYPIADRERPVEFLAGIWRENSLEREGRVKALHDRLFDRPCLLLEPEIIGEGFTLRVAWWGFGGDRYVYHPVIVDFPYRTILETSAKRRANRWQAIAERLLSSGESPETIDRLAGDNAANLELWEREKRWQTDGIETKDLALPYSFTREDFLSLSRTLAPVFRAVTAKIADCYHGNRAGVSPRLHDLGDSLVSFPDEGVEESIDRTLLEAYRHLMTRFESIDRFGQKKAVKTNENRAEKQDFDRNRSNTSFSFQGEKRAFTPPEPLPPAPCPLPPASLPIDPGTLSLARTLTGYSGQTASLAISPNGEFLIGAGDDQRIRLWRLGTGAIEQTLAGYPGRILALTLSADGRWLGSVHRDIDRSCIQLRDLRSGELKHSLLGHNKAARCLVITPDNASLISAGQKIKIWDTRTGALQYTLSGHEKSIQALSLSPNGQILASASADKTVRLWHLPSGRLLHTLTGHLDWVRAIAFSADGQLLASAGDDRSIRVWRVAAGQLLTELSGHEDSVLALAFAAPSAGHPRILFSAGKDGAIKRWQIDTGGFTRTFSGHRQWVSSLALCPRGRVLASGSDDRTIRIWKVA